MNEELVKMWNRVKGDNLSSTMLIVVIVVLVLLVAFVVMQFVNKRNRQKAQQRKHAGTGRKNDRSGNSHEYSNQMVQYRI